MEDMKKFELGDDELDLVAGGYANGSTVQYKNSMAKYCSKCGKLMSSYGATITGVRGVLDGATVYWVKLNCCGQKASVIESEIAG